MQPTICNVYRRNGVQEYLVWQVGDEVIQWLSFQRGRYAPLKTDENGLIQSQRFPGLQLQAQALLAGDLAQVLTNLQRALSTSGHREFINTLTRPS